MIKLQNLLFGSDPVVAHCPGPLHENWEFFAEEVFATVPESRPSRESAIFLTWHGPDRAEKPNGLLERCAARHGCEFAALRHEGPGWTNSRKLAMTADALDRTDAEFVVGLDSCDVLVVDHPDEIVRRFRAHFACDLLFNATGSACWPEFPEFVMFESSLPGARRSQGRCWLNSGAFVGKTAFCREYFRALAEVASANGYENDQTVVKATWPRYYPRVQIDDRCEIFQWFNESREALRFARTVHPEFREVVRCIERLPVRRFGAMIGFGDSALPELLLDTFPEVRLWFVEPIPAAQGVAPDVHERNRRKRLWRTAHAAARCHELHRPPDEASRLFPPHSLDFALIGPSIHPSCTDFGAWSSRVNENRLLRLVEANVERISVAER